VRGTVIRVDVEHLPKPTGRVDKTLSLWWSGPGEPNLEWCLRSYLRRFDIEQTFRFAKGPSAGRRPNSVRPPRRTAGPGSSSPRIPNSDWLAASSLTSSSPGSDHVNRRSSAATELPAQDGPKAPEKPAIRRSRRLLDTEARVRWAAGSAIIVRSDRLSHSGFPRARMFCLAIDVGSAKRPLSIPDMRFSTHPALRRRSPSG
jgi:hypothetical protein